MSTETNQTMTLNDPLDAPTLKRFEELAGLRLQLAERLLDLEQERVKTLRAASNLDVERSRLFETILTTRGLPPNHPVQVDAKTGIITLLEPPPVEPSAPAEAPAEPVAVTAEVVPAATNFNG